MPEEDIVNSMHSTGCTGTEETNIWIRKIKGQLLKHVHLVGWLGFTGTSNTN